MRERVPAPVRSCASPLLSSPLSHFTTDLLYFAALGCALIAQLLVIRSIAATPAEVTGPGGIVVHRSREMMWTVLTAAALAVTFAFVWIARHDGALLDRRAGAPVAPFAAQVELRR